MLYSTCIRNTIDRNNWNNNRLSVQIQKEDKKSLENKCKIGFHHSNCQSHFNYNILYTFYDYPILALDFANIANINFYYYHNFKHTICRT